MLCCAWLIITWGLGGMYIMALVIVRLGLPEGRFGLDRGRGLFSCLLLLCLFGAWFGWTVFLLCLSLYFL